jgi:hypothetical protein
MPAPADLDPAQSRIIQEILDRELPGFELVRVELPRVQPAPPVMAGKRGEDDVPRSPSLETLQAHYRKDERRLPDPRHPAPPEDSNDPGILRCRVRAGGAQAGEEIEVLISMSDQTIIQR